MVQYCTTYSRWDPTNELYKHNITSVEEEGNEADEEKGKQKEYEKMTEKEDEVMEK